MPLKTNVRSRFIDDTAFHAVLQMGDSTGSHTNTTSQSNFPIGRVGNWGNIAGFQARGTNTGSGGTSVIGSQKAQLLTLDPAAAPSGAGSPTVFQVPGTATTAGDVGVTSVACLTANRVGFSGNVAHIGGPFAVQYYELQNSPNAATPRLRSLSTGWRALTMYFDDEGTAGTVDRLRFSGIQGGTENHWALVNLPLSVTDGRDINVNGTGTAPTIIDPTSGGATGLIGILQEVSGASTSGTIRCQISGSNTNETGREFINVPTIFIDGSASGGLVMVNGGWGGWNVDDWLRDSGSESISDRSISEVADIMDTAGVPIDTLIIDLGINGVGQYTVTDVKALIEKIVAQLPGSPDVVVLLIVPWVPTGDTSFTTANHDTALERAQQVASEGTASVSAANIDVISRFELLGRVPMDEFAGGTWVVGSGDFVHPSPFGSESMTALEWATITDDGSASGGGARSRDFRARGWGVR